MQTTTKPTPSEDPKSPSSHDPVLTPEDEAFFRQVMARPEDGGAGSAEDGNAVATTSAEGGAVVQDTTRDPEEIGKKLGEEQRRASTVDNGDKGKEKGKEKESKEGEKVEEKKKKRSSWGWLKRMGTKKKVFALFFQKIFDDCYSNEYYIPQKAKDSKDADAKEPESQQPEPSDSASKDQGKDKDTSAEEQQQQPKADDDMSGILEQLNLAAENNRVFSASDEMQELLRKFKLIFKDLINGVPTAYHDLEMLLKNGNKQLQDTYSNLPGFLQKLIEKLPEKWTESLAPEVLAAASEKAGMNAENAAKASAAASKMGFQVPSLKELVGKPAAIVGMMRSIVAFLKARFPALIGVNVLWSLALSSMFTPLPSSWSIANGVYSSPVCPVVLP